MLNSEWTDKLNGTFSDVAARLVLIDAGEGICKGYVSYQNCQNLTR